ncbi:hypothetical protein QYE76_003760 [Lolium multiflorum]|uniref:Uncharacterized protein n=1 Tax=Lolium multiflorum TaxID=4521 RepID=A0AAD8VZ49_LOLMU|nr:hypothetical protein QYE76_003760 [Lolium multiflorum]
MQFKKCKGVIWVERLIGIIPPKSNQEPRRHIQFKDASGRHEIVTLSGEHAENFDAQGHHPAFSKDSIIQLFLGIMTVAQFSGMIAFKNTLICCVGTSTYQFLKWTFCKRE